MSSSTKTQLPLRGNMPSVHFADDIGDAIRTSPYYPGLRAPRTEKVLHPVLMSAQVLDPIPEHSELHVRLHPALANAKPSYSSQDAEDLIPLPLFSSPDSRPYPRVLSTTIPSNDSKEPSMRSSPLLTMLIAEVDAEIAALSSSINPTVNRDRPAEQDIPMQPSSRDENGHEHDSIMLGRTDTIDKELSATSRWMRNIQQRVSRKRATAKLSISNFKELEATVASARIQTFKASPEYLAYSSDQEAICRDTHRMDARERVADFEKSPMWQQYVDDVTLVLEQGNIHDLDSITGSSSATELGASNGLSTATDEAPPIPPRLRRKEARMQL